MIKIIRNNNHLTVIIGSDVLTRNDCTDEAYNELLLHQTEEDWIRNFMSPEFAKKKAEVAVIQEQLSYLPKSKYLVQKAASIYMPHISEVSLPSDLVQRFLQAEQESNQELIDTYINFWTLCSLNPDSRARQNLFWFLNRYGLHIAKSGPFVAYRYVIEVTKDNTASRDYVQFITDTYTYIRYKMKKSPLRYFILKDKETETYSYIAEGKEWDSSVSILLGTLKELYDKLSSDESDVSVSYTDQYTKSFDIRIGKEVRIPREECNSNQDVTCSQGLHVAGRSWLYDNNFGDTIIVVLINPADVIAVPPKHWAA